MSQDRDLPNQQCGALARQTSKEVATSAEDLVAGKITPRGKRHLRKPGNFYSVDIDVTMRVSALDGWVRTF